MLIDTEAITRTPRGYRVEKKISGQPRLRKTFDSYEEAERVLERYMRGEALNMAVTSGITQTTWKALFDLTVRRKWRHGKSMTQQDNARRSIERYLGWQSDVRDFDQDKADALADALERDMKSMTTVSHYLSSVRTMLKIGSERGLITWKLPKLEHYASTETRINFFEYDQEQRIINVMRQCGRPDLSELFIVLVETGMRTAEGMYLKWQDVDMRDGLIRIWGDGTKTGKSRRVPITQRCRDALMRRHMERPEGEARVFPRATKSSVRSIWEHVRRAENNYDRDFVWYTTRHTCASRLMRAGVDVKTIQSWLGHKRIETTMRYVQFSSGSLSSAAEALEQARRRA